MSDAAAEVPDPILNSPFAPPAEHWHIVRGEPPERRPGRRPAAYFYRDPHATAGGGGMAVDMPLVNLVRERVAAWRAAGYAGVTRTTRLLLDWWGRPDRADGQRLFFAQREAAESVIFLVEARADFRQGIAVPADEPSAEQRAAGVTGFTRYACKMQDGDGQRQDDRDGDAGRVERPQQARPPQR